MTIAAVPDGGRAELQPCLRAVAAPEAVFLRAGGLAAQQGAGQRIFLRRQGGAIRPQYRQFVMGGDVGQAVERHAGDPLQLRVGQADAPARRLGEHNAHGQVVQQRLQPGALAIQFGQQQFAFGIGPFAFGNVDQHAGRADGGTAWTQVNAPAAFHPARAVRRQQPVFLAKRAALAQRLVATAHEARQVVMMHRGAKHAVGHASLTLFGRSMPNKAARR